MSTSSATLHAVRTTRTRSALQVQKMDVKDQGAQMEPLLPAVRRSFSRYNAANAVHYICPIRDRMFWLNGCVRDLDIDGMARECFAHLQFEGVTHVTVAFYCIACCSSRRIFFFIINPRGSVLWHKCVYLHVKLQDVLTGWRSW